MSAAIDTCAGEAEAVSLFQSVTLLHFTAKGFQMRHQIITMLYPPASLAFWVSSAVFQRLD